MTNHCGSCTQCCKVLGIQELHKPANHWCPHVRQGQGCSIYPDRPPSCREYECLWLQSQSQKGYEMPLSMRPDKSKVVMSLDPNNEIVNAFEDRSRPGAAEKPEFVNLFKRLAYQGMKVAVGFSLSVERVLYERKNDIVTRRTIKLTPADENGVQQYIPENQ